MTATSTPATTATSLPRTPRQLLVDGEFVDARSGKTFATHDPATGEVLAHLAEADAPDVDIAVRAARRAFEEGPWSRMTPAQRARIQIGRAHV